MLYVIECRNSVLTVHDGELSMDDMPCGMVSRLWVSRQAACAMKFGNPTFYGYIQVLLIKLNSTVYICYMLYII